MIEFLVLALVVGLMLHRVRVSRRNSRPAPEVPEVVDIAALEHELLSPEFMAWLAENGEVGHPEDCRACNPHYIETRPLLHQPKPRPTPPKGPGGGSRGLGGTVAPTHPWCEEDGQHFYTHAGPCALCGDEPYVSKEEHEWASVERFLAE